LQDLIDPAVIGTTSILQAIVKGAPTVKKVILTSSFAAVCDPSKGSRPGYVYTETDWNPMTLENALSNPGSGYTGMSPSARTPPIRIENIIVLTGM
jgi:nucleoside-diphosphate-sugar epimerase